MKRYFDNAATTPVLPEVVTVIKETMEQIWGNPSSIYEVGVEAKKVIGNAKKAIAKEINCSPEEIVFTSGASESNALAIQGYINNNLNTVLYTTNIEHASIDLLYKSLNTEKHLLKVNPEGILENTEINKIVLKQKQQPQCKILVSVQYANNEIGTIQDIKRISTVLHDNIKNVVFHTDATQAFGHIKIDVKELGIDMMSVSGHKIGTPKGIGFLYVKKGISLKPIIYGAQENGIRGGTENVPYIAGLHKAIELISFDKEESVRKKRDYLWNSVIQNIKGKINGSLINRLSNNINIRIYGVKGNELVSLLNLNHFYISTGSACSSGNKNPSHVLKAIGLSEKEIEESVRITISDNLSYLEIDDFVRCLQRCVDILRFFTN